MDVRGFFERQALVKLAEGFGHFQIHLVVHQPERDFGNARRPFANFNAVKLVHVHLRQPVDFVQRQFRLLAEKFLERFEFKLAQFAVGDDEEVAAAAGGIEKFKAGKVCRGIPPAARGVRWSGRPCVLSNSARKVVEKQRADDFENVAFAGVVRRRSAGAPSAP